MWILQKPDKNIFKWCMTLRWQLNETKVMVLKKRSRKKKVETMYECGEVHDDS